MYLQAESGFGMNLDYLDYLAQFDTNDHHRPATVAHTGEGGGEEGEVVHLLEADHVRPVLQDLLEDAPSPAAPVKNAGIAKAEVIQLCSNRYKHIFLKILCLYLHFCFTLC